MVRHGRETRFCTKYIAYSVLDRFQISITTWRNKKKLQLCLFSKMFHDTTCHGSNGPYAITGSVTQLKYTSTHKRSGLHTQGDNASKNHKAISLQILMKYSHH
jgi:hypothetical protein